MPDLVPTPAPDPSRRLAADQLRLALQNLAPNHWLMPLFAAVICAMFTRWIPWPRLVLWFLLVAVGGAPLGYVARHFLKLSRDEAAMDDWIRHATLAYFLFALSWSAMGVFLWRPRGDLDHMLIMLIVGCTLSGNSALVGASRPLTIVGYAMYGSALVLLPLQQGGLIYDGLSLLALMYVGYLAYMSRQIYFTARDMLILRDDKNDLIVALEHSKAMSDAAAQKAEAASRAKSEFLANMSHELRTPLNAILGFSEMIQSGHFAAQAGKHTEYAGLVHQSGRHLLALINDILDLAKIEAGGLHLDDSDVDLSTIIANAIKLMSPRAAEAKVALVYEKPVRLPLVRGDERCLTQILLNLLSNAVKFTPPGGNVIAFARLEADGALAFGVRDDGIGIADEDQARVFESFGQGRHDVVTVDKGTGLGLPIVKGLAAAHGAQIFLHSRISEGTTVTIVMPASRVLSAASQAA